MNGRERVERALRFSGPDRIPVSLPPPYPNDILECWPDRPPLDTSKGPTRDEWGSLWASVSPGAIGEVVEPAIIEWDRCPHFRIPPVNDPEPYARSARAVAEDRGERYAVGVLPVSLFARAHHIRGLNNVLADFYLNPDRLAGLVDTMVALAVESVERYHAMGAHGVMMYDDWGLQGRLMIHPALWRQFYKERYARVWSRAHELGMTNWLHSCGKISDILEDMIEAGLDVVQMDQQVNMGVESLGQRFGGRLTFWCPVDIQMVMPTNDAAAIEGYVQRLIRAFGSRGGGFIGKWYPSPQAAGHSQEMIRLMCESFLKYGRYD